MLLRLEDITFRYRNSASPAIAGLDLSIGRGETVGIVGASGCGKSTLGQIVSGLLRQTGGRILFGGSPIRSPFRGEARRSIQILFQHPETSFNPKLTLLDSLKEPYRLTGKPFSRPGLLGFLSGFGLYGEHLYRKPHALSGGELQRLALARIMLMEPALVVLDEPTSMLDVISQAQIIRLLTGFRRQTGISCLFISHDLPLSVAFCDRILTLSGGRLA
ncbi:MAG: dipeptide/oligopeptide/nickel ABC transporter ATP-binding protein [Deltaproteobacteria bacterium]|jgi:ABC-type dipeptide/oligopeptide/nickel transport system ATPase subunit|nr:dipeptide/oligopeptide/nickel ABC transporter ATP-binding protein [Deltaproteobacteria bacterium]